MWQMNGPGAQTGDGEATLFPPNTESRPQADSEKAKEKVQVPAEEKTIWHTPKPQAQTEKKKEPFSVLKMQLLLCAAVLLAVVLVKLLFKEGFAEYAHQLDVWLSQGIDFAQRDEAARFVAATVDGIRKTVTDFWQMMQP